jgi:type II secretory pathway pseudopilin PulG
LRSKKGIAKFWIEVIGGVLVVAIIIVIILFAMSTVSNAVVDNANANSFNAIFQTLAQARSEGKGGTEAASPWELLAGDDNTVYAIAFVSTAAAQQFSGLDRLDKGGVIGQKISKDQDDKFNIKKCTLSANDACYCLFRIQYGGNSRTTCDDLTDKFNMIYVDYTTESTVDKDGQPRSTASRELDKAEAWSRDKLAGIDFVGKQDILFGSYDNIKEVKVISCILIKGEAGCSWIGADGNDHPCVLHVSQKKGSTTVDMPLVWMHSEGANTLYQQQKPLRVEEFIIDMKQYSDTGQLYPLLRFKWMDNVPIEAKFAADAKPCNDKCEIC